MSRILCTVLQVYFMIFGFPMFNVSFGDEPDKDVSSQQINKIHNNIIMLDWTFRFV